MPGQLIPPTTTGPEVSNDELLQRLAALEAAVEAIPAPESPGPQMGFAFEHIQEDPATIWDLHHGLGYDPAAYLVIDLNGERWWPRRIEYIEPGQTVRLTFTESIVGSARTS